MGNNPMTSYAVPKRIVKMFAVVRTYPEANYESR